jgi:hypothetical protein
MGAPAVKGLAAAAAPAKPLAGPILSLTARPLSAGGALIAAQVKRSDETPDMERVLYRGEPMNARAGRADDFSWPRI